MTIRLQFNKDFKWTKALKYMLADLKWCFRWFTELNVQGKVAEAAAAPSMASSMALPRVSSVRITSALSMMCQLSHRAACRWITYQAASLHRATAFNFESSQKVCLRVFTPVC